MTASRLLHSIAALICIATVGQSSVAMAQFGQSTAAARYFTGRSGINLPVHPSRRPAPAPQPMNLSNGQKPFSGLHQPRTISPYLSLDIQVNDDNGEALPNYYAFYRPQREQQEAIESQQAQIRRLQQQARVANASSELSRRVVPGMPTTGTSSQFMNIGSYYPGLR